MKQFTKEEKANLLEFLKGDVESFNLGMAMYKNYALYFPKEKRLRRKVKKLVREFVARQRQREYRKDFLRGLTINI